MSVIQFPSEPQDGLLARHEETAYAWRARHPILGVSVVPGTLETGERFMTIKDSRGVPMWLVCRERGEVAITDCNPDPAADSDNWGEEVPRGTCPAADSLREDLTRDD